MSPQDTRRVSRRSGEDFFCSFTTACAAVMPSSKTPKYSIATIQISNTVIQNSYGHAWLEALCYREMVFKQAEVLGLFLGGGAFRFLCYFHIYNSLFKQTSLLPSL